MNRVCGCGKQTRFKSTCTTASARRLLPAAYALRVRRGACRSPRKPRDVEESCPRTCDELTPPSTPSTWAAASARTSAGEQKRGLTQLCKAHLGDKGLLQLSERFGLVVSQRIQDRHMDRFIQARLAERPGDLERHVAARPHEHQSNGAQRLGLGERRQAACAWSSQALLDVQRLIFCPMSVIIFRTTLKRKGAARHIGVALLPSDQGFKAFALE